MELFGVQHGGECAVDVSVVWALAGKKLVLELGLQRQFLQVQNERQFLKGPNHYVQKQNKNKQEKYQ